MKKTKSHKLPKVKTRIMFCSGLWLTGGMERKMANLFGELINYYDIYLLTVSNGRSVIEIPPGIKTIVISEKEFYENYSDIALRHANKHNIDVVIGVMNLFYGQLDLYEKCNQNQIKTIAANSEYYFYPYYNQFLYNVVSRRQEVFKLVDAVIWQTNFSAAVYGHINANGYVMPNLNTFPKQIQLAKKSKKIIICVGRFNDFIKRIDRILSCFSKVLEQEPEATLWLVGPCDREPKIERLGNKSIKDMMKEQKLDDSRIVFIGEVDSVEKYYRQASVFLLTSESEGFCNVINEAACFGLPIVYNEIPGLEDLVVDGYNGLVSQQNDIDALANNVCKVLSDTKLREKLGRQASKYAERFSVGKNITKWKKVIDTVKSSSGASDVKNKLDTEFGYKIDDYYRFCAVLTRELNNAFDACNKDNNLISGRLCDTNNKLNDVTGRLNDVSGQLELATNQYHDAINSRAWKAVNILRSAKTVIKKIIGHATRTKDGS